MTGRDNKPLPGANIYIPDISKGTVAARDGRYLLTGLPSGKIRIQYSYMGYENVVETVFLAGAPLIMNINLKPTSIEAEEVVVTGGYNSTQHENAVKIDVLKLNSSSGVNAPEICERLRSVPGVDMISKGGGEAKPVIRGMSMNDILVLDNGVRFENYQYSDHHPLGIDEFGLDNVEVIKGPASLFYGSDAIGGAIDFIREKPAPVGTINGDYNLGLFSNSLGMINNIGMKASSRIFFGGLRFGNKTFADYLQGGGAFVPNTRFSGNSLKANAGMNYKNVSMSLFYDYSRYKVGLAEEEAVGYVKEHGRGRNPEVYYMLLDNQLLSSRNKIYLNACKLEVNAACQTAGLAHAEGPGDIAIEMQLRTLTWESRLYLPSSKNAEYILSIQGLNQTNTNLHHRETILLPDAVTANYSGYGMIAHTLFGKLKVQAGMRYDYRLMNTEAVIATETSALRPSLTKSYGSFSGSLGATFKPSERILFRLNFAKAYRNPNLAELTSDGLHESRYEKGDARLLPEEAYETDLSVHYHAGAFSMDIAGFCNLIRDYIFLAPTSDTTLQGDKIFKYHQSNAGLYGFEAKLHLHPFSLDWLHLETSYSTVTGKQKSGDYLPFIPAGRLEAEIRLEKEKPGRLQHAFMQFNVRGVIDQDHPAPGESFTAGYALFDFSVGGNVKTGARQAISFEFGIKNLLDKKYVDHLSTLKEVNYFNPGRDFTVSVKIPFGGN